MTPTYTQCRLRIHGGMTEKTAWIPTRYAEAGATLDAEYVEEHEHDFRHQREASDI